MRRAIIRLGDQTITAELVSGEVIDALIEHFPLEGELRRYGDEMYFLVDFGVEYPAGGGNTFEVGDIIYWRSQKSEKEAIALFFGNTPIEDGRKPRAPSDAIVIGSFDTAGVNLPGLQTGLHGSLVVE